VNGQANVPAGLSGMAAVSAGTYHSVAIRIAVGAVAEMAAAHDLIASQQEASAMPEASIFPDSSPVDFSEARGLISGFAALPASGSILEHPHSGESISVLADLTPSGDRITFHFTVRAGPSRRILIRALGPTLAPLQPNRPAVATPRLEVFMGDARIASNADWSAAINRDEITEVTRMVGAIPL
jgi:hypothetical protein